MTSSLLAPLIEANLAAAMAILTVLALRRPARALIGARTAYGLWLIVPAAMLAVLAPPRIVRIPAPAPVASVPVFDMSAGALAHAQPAALAAQSSGVALDMAQVLLGVWLAQFAVSLVLLAVGQRRAVAKFGPITADAKDPRLARAFKPMVGPAVVGVFRPWLIVPADFETRFDASERAMILAHERVHLASGHAPINALTALVQALNWFNPLIHLAARYARVDQELACDAAVVIRFPGERRTYARALLKTQLAAAAPPFGCAWPARSSSLLAQRIEMLAQDAPGRLRLAAGAAVVAALTVGAGLAAWSAEPPVKEIAPPANSPQAPSQPPGSATSQLAEAAPAALTAHASRARLATAAATFAPAGDTPRTAPPQAPSQPPTPATLQLADATPASADPSRGDSAAAEPAADTPQLAARWPAAIRITRDDGQHAGLTDEAAANNAASAPGPPVAGTEPSHGTAGVVRRLVTYLARIAVPRPLAATRDNTTASNAAAELSAELAAKDARDHFTCGIPWTAPHYCAVIVFTPSG